MGVVFGSLRSVELARELPAVEVARLRICLTTSCLSAPLFSCLLAQFGDLQFEQFRCDLAHEQRFSATQFCVLHAQQFLALSVFCWLFIFSCFFPLGFLASFSNPLTSGYVEWLRVALLGVDSWVASRLVWTEVPCSLSIVGEVVVWERSLLSQLLFFRCLGLALRFPARK